MARKGSHRSKQPVAVHHCRHFAGGQLAGSTRAGLAALQQHHRERVQLEQEAGCSVALDACREPHEPNADRWDYVVTLRDTDHGLGIEPHPAYADQVQEIVRKKQWAEQLLRREAPTLQVQAWIWLTGADEEPGFTPAGPLLRLLSAEGIKGPRRRVP
jgi:hypothetical protein